MMKLHNRKPDIENLYKVLRREKPSRPVLFELFMNWPLYERLANRKVTESSPLENLKLVVDAFTAAGYDYATTHGSDFAFQAGKQNRKETVSMNEGFVITDEESFEKYQWPNPSDFDYSRLEKICPYLPDGLKLMCMGPSGVLENTIALAGYDNLCYMLFDYPELAGAIFNRVGELIFKYYETVLQFDTVGVIMCNDDWGFKTQTFLSPADMRKYVFPWYKKYVDMAHSKNIPAVLHSCGYAGDIMDDIIDDMGFDGKHSFEDAIISVEDSYEKYHNRIAILGGIDVDFMIQKSEGEITARCKAMLERTESRGAYALGTGNSVPEYIPQDKYLALIKTALD